MLLESSKLLRPTGYLRIKEESTSTGDVKKHLFQINWVYPFFITVLAVAYFIVHPKIANPFIPDGIFDGMKQFLQILPGFYIAALAAIATCDKASFDQMFEDPLVLQTKEHGKVVKHRLTPRRFICYVFGYLSFLSILLCLGLSLLIGASPTDITKKIINEFFLLTGESFDPVFLESIGSVLDYCLLFVFLFFFFQLITVTLVGLFYLSDRLHWEGKSTIQKVHTETPLKNEKSSSSTKHQ